MALFITCLLHFSVSIHPSTELIFIISEVLQQPVHLRSTWTSQRKMSRKAIPSPLQHMTQISSQFHSWEYSQWEYGMEKFVSLVSGRERIERNDFSLFTLLSSEKEEILWALYCMYSSHLLKSYSIRWLFACIFFYLPSEGLDALKSGNVFYIFCFVPNRCSVNVI